MIEALDEVSFALFALPHAVRGGADQEEGEAIVEQTSQVEGHGFKAEGLRLDAFAVSRGARAGGRRL